MLRSRVDPTTLCVEQRPLARLKAAAGSFSGVLDSRQHLRPWPDVAAAPDEGTAVSFHSGYLCVSAPKALVEEPRRGVGFKDQKMHSLLGILGGEPGPGMLHESGANSLSLEGTRDVQIVDKGAPLGVVRSVCANEPSQLGADDRQSDELILRRVIKSLAPNT